MKVWPFALLITTLWAGPIEIETTTDEEAAAVENPNYQSAVVAIVGNNWQDLQFLYHYHQSKQKFPGGDLVVKCQLDSIGHCSPSKAFSNLNQDAFEKDAIERVAKWDFVSLVKLGAKIVYVPLHFTDFVESK